MQLRRRNSPTTRHTREEAILLEAVSVGIKRTGSVGLWTVVIMTGVGSGIGVVLVLPFTDDPRWWAFGAGVVSLCLLLLIIGVTWDILHRVVTRPGTEPPSPGATVGGGMTQVEMNHWLLEQRYDVPDEPHAHAVRDLMRLVIHEGHSFTQNTVRQHIGDTRQNRDWYDALRDCWYQAGWAEDSGNGAVLTAEGRAVARDVAIGGQRVMIERLYQKVREDLDERSNRPYSHDES